MCTQNGRVAFLSALVCFWLVPYGHGEGISQADPQTSDLIRVVENPVGYKLTSLAVMRKTYRYIADSELKAPKVPLLRFHLVGSTGSACLGRKDRSLEGGFATDRVPCVDSAKCDVVHAWLPDGHPQFLVPVMIRVLTRCNEVDLTKARFDAISQRAVGKAVDWRYDEAERRYKR